MMAADARRRLLLAVLFLAIAGALTVTVTASTALRFKAPQAALALWPWNGEAAGALAGRELVEGDNADAIRWGRRALRENPGSTAALRATGLAEEATGERAKGARLMDLAIRASRRDLLTNLWFIERNVARGDVDGAVRFYDFSLKSSAESEQLLFPILVPAMANPDIARAVERKLATRPVWTVSFLQYAFSSGAADEQLIPIALRLARDRTGLPDDLRHQYAQRLAERGNFTGLDRWARGLGREMIDQPGAIERMGPLPPVDWRLLAGEGVSTFAEANAGFSFIASAENAPLAERLLHLPAGRYAVRTTANLGSAANDARLRWTATCAQTGRPLAVVADGAVARFDVPAGCEFQKLVLALESERLSDGGEIQGEVRRIVLNTVR
jgi:tetratricopeptide (TPR) repeat protein